MAEIRNWENIWKHGLLSTSALLDLFECDRTTRSEIESQLRLKECSIEHHRHGTAVIRDQCPMRDRPNGISLKNLLVDLDTEDWLRLLNSKTFFWTEPDVGLKYMLGAVMYRSRSHYVITVSTRELLKHHASQVTLTSINSGSILGNNPKRRGSHTFKSIRTHSVPWVREVAVEYSVPNITEIALTVEEWKGDKKIRTVWPK